MFTLRGASEAVVGIHISHEGWRADNPPHQLASKTAAVNTAERYAAERRGGFRLLRFRPSIEREFRGAFTAMSRSRLRFALPVAMIADVGLLLLDQMLGQAVMSPAVLVMVGGMLLPLAVMTAWVFHPKGDWGRNPRLLFLLVLTINILSAAAVHEGRSSLASFPYEPYLIVGLFSYFLSGLTFWWALGVNLVALTCFGYSWLLLGAFSLYEAYFLVLLNVAGAIGLYFYEHQQRQSFLLGRELRWKADIDPLSGLMNHGAVKQYMRRSWAQSVRERKPIAVLMIDIDHFKAVNDGHGHELGDRVIRAVGSVLQDSLRRPLDAAGRLGGDEFVAMWFDVDADWMVLQAARIRQQLSGLVGPLGVEGRPVTLSIGGVCAGPESGARLERILQHADSMLYQVKREGRDSQRIVELGSPPSLDDQADATAVA